MRFTRLIIGFLVIVIAIFIIAGEQLSGASADAVINARLTTLRSATAGTLRMPDRVLGSSIARDELIGSVADPLVDDVHLNDLIREKAFSTAEVERLASTIDATETQINGLELRAETYRQERVRQLERQLDAARARQDSADARVSEARSMLKRSRELVERGIETSASLERNQAAQRVAETESDNALQQAAEAAIALQSARRGTFVGPGSNDAPYSEQRISELRLQIEEMKSMLAAEKERNAALESRIREERRRINLLSRSDIQSNADGKVWEILASDGETVQRGDAVVRLADCDSTLVTLSVSESVYNRLAPGNEAKFRMRGTGRVFDGTVTRLAGSGASLVYSNLAVAPSGRHLQRYDVALVVPALRNDPDLGCAIGRTGRVFFAARPLDFLRRIWR